MRVGTRTELLRLRTELELIHQCGRGADRPVLDALRALAAEVPRDDLQELLSILQDATSPLLAAAMARIDREFPDIGRELSVEVIASEAAEFRDDVAAALRGATRPDAEALADAYLQRSRVDTPDAGPSAGADEAALPADGLTSRPTPNEERSTMSENPTDSHNADAQAADQNNDRPVEPPDAAALDESNEAALDIDAIIAGAAEADQPVMPDSRKADSSPTVADEDDSKVDLTAFVASVEEDDDQDLDDASKHLDSFLAEALARVNAVDPPEPDPSAAAPTSGPEQLEQIARGEPRPPAGRSADVAETVEAALDDVESHLGELASGLDFDVNDEPDTTPPTRVDLEGDMTADEVLADVEVGAAALTHAVGPPPEPDPTPPPPASTPECEPPPEPEAIVTPPVADGPETPATPDAETPNPSSTTACEAPSNGPADTAVDEVEHGLSRLARFLSGEVVQLWTQARQAMQEARAFRNDSQRIHAETCRMFAEIQSLCQAVAAAREQAQGHQREARNLRDEIRQALERVRHCASEAANAADAAQAEARNAATFAEQARLTQRPGE